MGATDMVTSVSPASVWLCLAVTVATPPFSSMLAGDTDSVTCGRITIGPGGDDVGDGGDVGGGAVGGGDAESSS